MKFHINQKVRIVDNITLVRSECNSTVGWSSEMSKMIGKTGTIVDTSKSNYMSKPSGIPIARVHIGCKY